MREEFLPLYRSRVKDSDVPIIAMSKKEPGDPARQTSRQPRRRPDRDTRNADLLALRQRAQRRVHYLLGTQDGKRREAAVVDPRDLSELSADRAGT